MSMKMQDEDGAALGEEDDAPQKQQPKSSEGSSESEPHREKRAASRSRLLKQRKSSSSASLPPASTSGPPRSRKREGSTSSTTRKATASSPAKPAAAATSTGGGRKKLGLPHELVSGGEAAVAPSESELYPSPLPSSLAQVNSTTCLVARPVVHDGDSSGDDDDDALAQRRRKSSSSATKITIDSSGVMIKRSASYTSPRNFAKLGKFRYLKPEEIQRGRLPKYDFAVIANRSVKMPSRVGQLLSDCLCCCCAPGGNSSSDRGSNSFNENSSHERMGFRRLCLANSPLLRSSEDEHRRIVDKLCGQGLLVDIIDGGHSKGEMNSAYFILLIQASDEVVNAYLNSFRFHLWMEHGAVADMEDDIVRRNDHPPTPAERVQIVDYIIEQRANITTRDPWIHDMFPMHDKQLTDKLISRWITSWRVFDLVDRKILKLLRYNFGEKVSYYFAFFNYYNRALIPIAIIGVVLQFLHGVIPTETYMRILPFWGIGVSVIWSFTFLKTWERANATMQFEWNKKLHVKQIEYANKFFYGEKKVNSLTGELEVVYPAWRRLPKYFCVIVFMLFQTVIMLILVAIWVTIYEMLKAKYTESHIFSTQWFLILLEGIVFGLFVDVIQWNMVVTKMGALFTHWENYRTEEQYERALIRKLFLLDFLNYYTWFFSLAFVFVIPGFGDYLTNSLNRMMFGDAMNCCFGPYVDQHGTCIMCPLGPKDATCIECVGIFTFDRHHVDLSAMFVTPIVVTQLLNIALGVLMPKLVRMRREHAQASADAEAQKRVMEAGSMKILGSLDYEDKKSSQFGNKSSARYLEYTASEIEVLNKKAREILFDSEQDSYDPYNDFHAMTVQYGFTVMFSILWPLMPFACFLINIIKFRTDGYRLCKTLKRPIPRRANGIGAWKGILTAYAYIAVIVNVLLICISTGALEFFDETCVRDIENQLEKQGKTLNDFVLGPDFGCLHVTWRLLVILILEHILIGFAYLIMTRVPKVPDWIHVVMNARENQFKELLRAHEQDLFPPSNGQKEVSSGRARGATSSADESAAKERGILLSESRIDIADIVNRTSRAIDPELLARRNISVDSITPVSERDVSDLEVPVSDGHRAKAREHLARQWSAASD
ncbi:Protein required for meiotic chromosome segregation, partial [Globisporangium splendens]